MLGIEPNKTIEEMAAAQGIKPLDFEEAWRAAEGIWPEDESIDEFTDWLRGERGDAVTVLNEARRPACTDCGR